MFGVIFFPDVGAGLRELARVDAAARPHGGRELERRRPAPQPARRRGGAPRRCPASRCRPSRATAAARHPGRLRDDAHRAGLARRRGARRDPRSRRARPAGVLPLAVRVVGAGAAAHRPARRRPAWTGPPTRSPTSWPARHRAATGCHSPASSRSESRHERPSRRRHLRAVPPPLRRARAPRSRRAWTSPRRAASSARC